MTPIDISQLIGGGFNTEEFANLPDESERHVAEAKKRMWRSRPVWFAALLLGHSTTLAIAAAISSPWAGGFMVAVVLLMVVVFGRGLKLLYRYERKRSRRKEQEEAATEKAKEMIQRQAWLHTNVRVVIKLNPESRHIIYELQDIKTPSKVYRCYVAEAVGGEMEFNAEMLQDPEVIHAGQVFRIYEAPAAQAMRAVRSKWLEVETEVPVNNITEALKEMQEQFLENLPDTYKQEQGELEEASPDDE